MLALAAPLLLVVPQLRFLLLVSYYVLPILPSNPSGHPIVSFQAE